MVFIYFEGMGDLIMLTRKTSMALVAMAVLTVSGCNQKYAPANASASNDIPSATGDVAGVDATDIQQHLNSVGFNEPLTFNIDPTRINVEAAGIRHFYFDGTRSLGVVSLLAHTGRVNPVPDAGNPNGWRMDVPGVENPGTVRVAIGTRVITSRTNQRTWTEGAKEYTAETITYVIKRAPDIAVPGSADLGPFSFRLVIVNDPAVGEWRVDPFTMEDPRRDQDAVLQQVSNEGIAVIGSLAEKIRNARAGVTQ